MASQLCLAGAEFRLLLPTELWLAIILRIPEIRDLQSLRCVSKQLCYITTPITFRKLTLRDTQNSLRALRQISQTQTVSCAVQALVVVLLGSQDDRSRWIRGGMWA